jgi:hypothetical protein
VDRGEVDARRGGEVREVVDVGGVDDPVGRGRGGTQAVEVVEGAAVDLGAGALERCRGPVGAGQPDDLVSGVDELGDDRGTDPSCRSGDEYAHGDASMGSDVSRCHQPST